VVNAACSVPIFPTPLRTLVGLTVPHSWLRRGRSRRGRAERRMFVGNGVRCERRTEYPISSIAELACAYLCGVHIDFVRQVGPSG
jgi:hypothetical protein